MNAEVLPERGTAPLEKLVLWDEVEGLWKKNAGYEQLGDEVFDANQAVGELLADLKNRILRRRMPGWSMAGKEPAFYGDPDMLWDRRHGPHGVYMPAKDFVHQVRDSGYKEACEFYCDGQNTFYTALFKAIHEAPAHEQEEGLKQFNSPPPPIGHKRPGGVLVH